MTRRLCDTLFLILAGVWAGAANAQTAACGYDCSRPGRLVLCNDSVRSESPGQSVNCAASLGSCTFEAYCGTFRLPDGLTAGRLAAVFALIGPGDPTPGQYNLEVYAEASPVAATPGSRINASAESSYQLVGDPTRFQQIDLSPLGVDAYPVGSVFRVCLKKGFDGLHNICLDSDGNVPSSNWMFVDITSGGCPIIRNSWYAASGLGVTGDFLLRPELSLSDRSAWQPGGACHTPPADAGVSNDAALFADAGPVADGAPLLDAAPAQDAAPALDAALSADATSSADAGDADAASIGGDAGPSAAPKVSDVVPDEGKNDVPTRVTVIGEGFREGLVMKVGQISANDVSVRAPTTFEATVPANIAPATYDILVINPDGQAAVLRAGFTVLAKEGPLDTNGCSCRAAVPSGTRASSVRLLALVGLIFLSAKRCSRPSRPG